MSSLILQISAGVGPVEVRRFVGQLAGVLTRDVEARGLEVQATLVIGPEAEPTAVQLQLRGPEAALAPFRGTYVLVARNLERGKKDRKRWFAGVEVFPLDEVRGGYFLEERDLRIQTCRAGGPGGQHVNRTESAVRVLHVPSGITVRVATERSQRENRRQALELIRQALREKDFLARQDAQKERRYHHYRVQRGQAVRTFRLDRRGRLVEQKEAR